MQPACELKRAGRRRGNTEAGDIWLWACLILATVALGAGVPARAEQPAADALAQPGDAAAARAVLNGYRRYQATCSHCHGPDGVGSTFARR